MLGFSNDSGESKNYKIHLNQMDRTDFVCTQKKII